MTYKARSITSKASSACKMNMGLVSGEADVQNSKAFVDYGGMVEKAFKGGGGGTSTPEAKEEEEKEKPKGQSDAAVEVTDDTTDVEVTPKVETN